MRGQTKSKSLLVYSVEDRQAKGVPGPLACLSFLKRSRPAAGAGQTACLSVLSRKFCQGVAQETGEKKRPLSRAFLLATDCGELLGDYLHVASMPRIAIIIATTIANSIIVDSSIR